MVITLRFLPAILLLLSACSPIYETRYHYTPPQSSYGPQCLNQCLAQQQNCRNQYDIKKIACYYLQERTAQKEYDAYIRENCQNTFRSNDSKNDNRSGTASSISQGYDPFSSQRNNYWSQSSSQRNTSAHHESISGMQCRDAFPKKLSDFKQTGGCDSAYNRDMKNCDQTYRSCYENCGGKVESYQVCVAFCN